MIPKRPNILITGTPGVGKSRICSEIAKKCSFTWQDVSKIAKEHDFVEDHDEELDCPILDEEAVMDFLEPEIAKGGNIVEYHGCEFFPKRWFDAVFVVQCNNTVLYDRLQARGYNERKIKENVQCEIFQESVSEAFDSYDKDIVFCLSGETDQDFDESIVKITDFIRNWNE